MLVPAFTDDAFTDLVILNPATVPETLAQLEAGVQPDNAGGGDVPPVASIDA